MEKELEHKTSGHVNQGANVRKFRQLLDIKQEVLAEKMGTTQQALSIVENRKVIGEKMLSRIAEALKVPAEIIAGLEENPLSIIVENNTFDQNNTFESGSSNQTLVGTNDNNFENHSNQQIIHPLDKIMEISKETTSLYERIITLEKEKSAWLEQALKEKKG